MTMKFHNVSQDSLPFPQILWKQGTELQLKNFCYQIQ